MEQNKNDNLRFFFIICGVYAVFTYLHFLLKLFLVEPNFCDFAYFYFFADLLNKGINFLTLDQQTVDALKSASNIPVKICGGHPGGQILYSPSYYAAIMPLTYLDFNTAKLLWYIIAHLLLVISTMLILKITDIKLNAVNLSITSFILFIFQPLIETVALGHMADILLLSVLVFALLTAISHKHLLTGLFMAIVMLIRPHYGFILLLFLYKKLYSSFVYSIIFYCLISLLTIPIVGWDFYKDYLPGLLAGSKNIYNSLTYIRNLSFLSAIARLLDGQYIVLLKIFNLILTAAAALWTLKRFRGDFNKEVFPVEFSIMLTIIFFITPYWWDAYLIGLYIPIFIIYRMIGNMDKLWQYGFVSGFILLASLYSLERFSLFHKGIWSVFYNGRLYGVIIVLILLVKCYGELTQNKETCINNVGTVQKPLQD